MRPPVASIPAKEEELEFMEIPRIGEAEAEVLVADNETSSGADLDPVDTLPPTPTKQPILTPEVQPIPPSTQPQVPMQQQEATPEPRRSYITNRGVPPLRLAEMLLGATEGNRC